VTGSFEVSWRPGNDKLDRFFRILGNCGQRQGREHCGYTNPIQDIHFFPIMANEKPLSSGSRYEDIKFTHLGFDLCDNFERYRVIYPRTNPRQF
jgi:hypothetical protein